MEEYKPPVIVGEPGELTDEYNVLYSPTLASAVGHFYAMGESLNKIGQRPGMPRPNVLYAWFKNRQEFRDLITAARETRALYHEEQAIAAGTTFPSKDDAAGARLAFETHKWAAEVSNPERYGKKTTIQGDASKPLTIVVRTGVPEPLEHQRPPELGDDGLVKKAVKDIVIDEVSDESEVSS